MEECPPKEPTIAECTSLGKAAPWPPNRGTKYCLRGPQVEPLAGGWLCHNTLCMPSLTDIEKCCEFPGYPQDVATLQAEIEELIALAQLRDDPEAVANLTGPLPKRRGLSRFLAIRPLPYGAVYNRERDEHRPLIMTGRELARLFESETPGLMHRHALNYLISTANLSPPRQARIWAALDLAIQAALMAAWYYKWSAPKTRYRPRPIEYDYRVSVLFNHMVNPLGTGDGMRRLLPDPSPGTPRHPAYPSGHSTYAGAASEILSYFFPDYTEDFDDLADNVGMARLWAGIHWRSDHVNGMELGRCVARLIIQQLQQDGAEDLYDQVCMGVDYCAMPPNEGSIPCCRDRREGAILAEGGEKRERAGEGGGTHRR